MPEYNHNKTNSDSYKEYLKNKQSLNAQSKTEVKIARIKEISVEEVIRVTTENAKKIYGIE